MKNVILDQGSKGIRQWPINWCTSPMIMHKIIPSVDYNKKFNRLDTIINEPINQKVPKVVKATNNKTLL